MPKKPSQPALIREERAEYSITPEEQARKDEYRARLRTFLEDPASRQIEGFPLGEMDDILALSDPPYYTACPNPFLTEIIEQWQKERESSPLPLGEGSGVRAKYHREPFAADVSEGKNDPIYNAHSYHTKVPHKAIMRYILHYTEPGDIVFDGFCGTGMTGVAAQLCGDKKTVESLGYRVDDKGNIYDDSSPSPSGRGMSAGQGEGKGKLISHLGARKAVLNDLSPAATFIAYNFNSQVDVNKFEQEANRIIREVEDECGWMYETWHPNCDDPSKIKAEINYTIWSEVLSCPQCAESFAYYEEFFNHQTNEINEETICPNCSAKLNKDNIEMVYENIFDEHLNSTLEYPKRIPVSINYRIGKKSYNKKPDAVDISVLEKISSTPLSKFIPHTKLPDMQMTRVGRMKPTKIFFIHQFFLPRSAKLLSELWERAQAVSSRRIRALLNFWLESQFVNLSVRNRYRPGISFPYNPLSGVFYVPSMISEASVFKAYRNKIERIISAMSFRNLNTGTVVIETTSTSDSKISADTIDYIFTDPPFGENIYYSDLNFFTESWFQVFTNTGPEAIVDRVKRKALIDYEQMMANCFEKYYKVLKPGRWMTVEFHNSKNSVWNAIQQAITSVGFVIADVRVLDKQQHSFQQVTSLSAVKQDLVISAYKPNDNLEERFSLEAGTSDGAWDFVRYHLTKLPRVVEKNGEIEVVAERQAFLLFDRMVAFHIQRGASVPLSAGEFYAGLKQKFVERDGMYFLPDQVAEYDSARLRLGRVAQLALFVSDEKSAIQWLRQQLDPALGGEPKTFADLMPQFMRSGNQAKHELMPELSVILEQNFLEEKDGTWRTPNPSKATDLERLRLKALLKEFNEYVQSTGRLKQFRTEAVRAGFAEAYRQKEYTVILNVAARLPEDVLHEDPDLLMYYDTATLRAEQ